MLAGSIVRANSLGATATLLQGGRCNLTGLLAINTTVADAYVQVFNAAAAADVTVGTTVPDWVIFSPPGDVSEENSIPAPGMIFTLGIVVASTTTPTNATAATQHVRGVIV